MICNKPIPQIGVLGSVKGKHVYSKKKINESICIDYRGNVCLNVCLKQPKYYH